jgi:NRPS condensation-like uncharacterized protein
MMHLNIKQQLHSKKVKGTSNIVHAVNLMLQTGRAQTLYQTPNLLKKITNPTK